MKKYAFIIFFAAVFAAGGCRTTAYYHEQAAGRAREYLLENVSDFTAVEIAYIKYNKPAFLAEDILGEPASLEGELSSGLSQICVVWVLPEREYAYVVFGVSEGRMIEWRPKQLLLKKFRKENVARVTAINAARIYVLNNMFYDLTSAQYNRVRFSEPLIIRSNFELPLNPDGKLTADEVEKLKAKPQYSLIWELPGRPDTRLVISGQSGENMQGWGVFSSGDYTVEEVKSHTLPDEPEKPANAQIPGVVKP